MFPTRALLTAIILAPLALATPALGPKGMVACGRNLYEPPQVNSAVKMGYAQIRAGTSLGDYPHILGYSGRFPLARECRDFVVYEVRLVLMHGHPRLH
jgi:hypothetical protein